MSQSSSTEQAATPAANRPQLRKRRSISPVWAIPVVATLIGLWLMYQSYSQRGPLVTITFLTAEGLEAKKTRVKHKDVELGTVETIDLSEDLSKVIITARMRREAEPFIRENTRFWVARARLSAAGVSGLGTLLSGSHVEMDPGPGAPKYDFAGLEEPPIIRAGVAGREFLLQTDRILPAGPGSPVLFRGLKVGEVLRYDTEAIERSVMLHIFIRAPYDKLVYEGSRFWNASGISFNTGPQGFKIELESLQALLAGGIAFETPEAVRVGTPSAERTVFPLFQDTEAVRIAGYTTRTKYVLHFEGSVSGIEKGSQVTLRGLEIGRVTDVQLQFDATTLNIRAPVTIEVTPEIIAGAGRAPDAASREAIMANLVARGLRAQIRTASLITGQSMIAFDFFPEAPAAALKTDGPLPELPTVPTDLDNIIKQANRVMSTLAALPLEDVVKDLRGTLEQARGVIAAPEVTASLRSLESALKSVDRLASQAQTQIGPLFAALVQVAQRAQDAMNQAQSTLLSADQSFGKDSALQRDLIDLIAQLQDAARSFRVLAEYLEQHPEALVRGKTEGSK